MFKFFKESIKEFDHVVWPTNKETKNYFISVTSIIIVLTLILFLVGTAFSSILFIAKEIINPAKITQNSSNTNSAASASWIKINADAITASGVNIPTTVTK